MRSLPVFSCLYRQAKVIANLSIGDYTSSMSTIPRHTGSVPRIDPIPAEPIFDYVALSEALSQYRRPRDRITRLLRTGRIIRLKKGLYCRPDELSNGVLHRGVIANLLYGPSYVSLQTALSAYGMIPEEVVHLTSITTGKAKRYNTPIGAYLYRAVSPSYYWRGVRIVGGERYGRHMCASPEKAVADIVYFTPGLRTEQAVADFLFDDLRIGEEELCRLDAEAFAHIAAGANKPGLSACSSLLRELTG